MKLVVVTSRPLFSPQRVMANIPPHLAVQALNEVFKTWGLPQRIKIDNGWPFIHARYLDNPTLSILWWIGLGIEVIQNDPGCPQQNGTVEGLQNICFRWVNPSKYESVDQLQAAMDEISLIQRSVYRVPAKKYATRLELYPDLLRNPRRYDPALFEMNSVWAYLSQQVWQRIIKLNGSISFMGTEIYVSQNLSGQTVTLTFDPIDQLWVIHSIRGAFLKASDKQIITEDQILTHAGMSKN